MADYKKTIKIEADVTSAKRDFRSLLSSLEKDASTIDGIFKKIPKSFTSEFAAAFENIKGDVETATKLINTIALKKELKLDFAVDEKKLEQIKEKLGSSELGKRLIEQLEKEEKPIEEKEEPQKEESKFKKDLATIKKTYSPLNRYKENGRYETMLGATVGKFAKAMTNAIDSIGKFFVTTFKEAFKNLSKMATYDAGSTLYSNREARERQLIFGLTGAQNYAMSTAMTTMGMSGVEDLFWANAKQQEQYQKMTAILEAQYNKLEASGIMETTQQFQLDMAMMKLQFQNTVYQFIAAHRSQLEKVLEMSLNFMSAVLDGLGVIVDWLASLWGNNQYGSSDTLAAASNISNTSNDNSKTINATINYTDQQSRTAESAILTESVMDQLITVLNA